MNGITKNRQYYKFSAYGFLKNLRFFDAFLLLFLVDKGLSFTQIGILYAIREIFINVFEVPSGFIADTYGRKNSLVASFIFYIASFMVFYFSGLFWLFIIAFSFYGIADAFRSGTHKGMIMDYLRIHGMEDQKISYYGHTRAWSQTGSALSSLVAGLIVFTGGNYADIFLFSVIPYLFNLVLIISYPRELNFSRNGHTGEETHRLKDTVRSFLVVIRDPAVLRIINTSALHTAYIKALKDYIQPLMVHVALLLPILVTAGTERKNGIVIGVIYFIIYLLTSLASRNSSRLESGTRRNIPYLTLLAGFAAGILTGLSFHLEWWVTGLIAFAMVYVMENIRKPILTAYVANNVPNEILTSVISAQSLVKTILTAGIAFIFGILADNYDIGWAFLLVSAFLILSSILLNFLSGRKFKLKQGSG